MKLDIDDLTTTYHACVQNGNIKEKFVDFALIRSLSTVAERGLAFIKNTSTHLPAESTDWTFVFRDYYESLRGLIEAYLLFAEIAAENHQCKYAYLCFRHPELELDWAFLEMIRLKRNAINYRGQLLQYADWKIFQMKFELHISVLRKEIARKLAEMP